MIVYRGRLSFPKLDADKWTEWVEEQVEVQMRQAAREWLRAVIPRVPVWTGTARGSLVPLGRFVRVAVPISPKAVRPGMGPGVGQGKTPQNYDYYFKRQGHRFYFRYSTNVFHFIQNEFYEAPDPPFHLRNPTPWHALEAGDTAFRAYVRDVFPKVTRMKRLKDFLSFDTKVIEP